MSGEFHCPKCQELLSGDPVEYTCPGRPISAAEIREQRAQHWPFANESERRDYDVKRAQALAMLRDTHHRFMAALETQP